MIANRKATTPTGTNATLADSISFITNEDAGSIVVCASHGGASSGEYASQRRLELVILNDAGVGKDAAGIEALRILEQHGAAACTVSHESARIGDVLDHWDNGIISHTNTTAAARIRPGMTVQAAVDAWASAEVSSRPARSGST